MSRFRPAGFRNGRTAWRRASRPDRGRPARRRSTASRDGWTAWRRRASRNPAAPRNAVSPWEAGAPRSAASRWEAAANPWLGAIARCSRTGSSNPSPSTGESANFRSLALHRPFRPGPRPARRHGRQRRAGLVNITPTAGNISVGLRTSVSRKRDKGFETAPFDGAAAGHRASDLSPGTLPNSARYSGSP
jgi:hypothetical protein